MTCKTKLWLFPGSNWCNSKKIATDWHLAPGLSNIFHVLIPEVFYCSGRGSVCFIYCIYVSMWCVCLCACCLLCACLPLWVRQCVDVCVCYAHEPAWTTPLLAMRRGVREQRQGWDAALPTADTIELLPSQPPCVEEESGDTDLAAGVASVCCCVLFASMSVVFPHSRGVAQSSRITLLSQSFFALHLHSSTHYLCLNPFFSSPASPLPPHHYFALCFFFLFFFAIVVVICCYSWSVI